MYFNIILLIFRILCYFSASKKPGERKRRMYNVVRSPTATTTLHIITVLQSGGKGAKDRAESDPRRGKHHAQHDGERAGQAEDAGSRAVPTGKP